MRKKAPAEARYLGGGDRDHRSSPDSKRIAARQYLCCASARSRSASRLRGADCRAEGDDLDDVLDRLRADTEQVLYAIFGASSFPGTSAYHRVSQHGYCANSRLRPHSDYRGCPGSCSATRAASAPAAMRGTSPITAACSSTSRKIAGTATAKATGGDAIALIRFATGCDYQRAASIGSGPMDTSRFSGASQRPQLRRRRESMITSMRAARFSIRPSAMSRRTFRQRRPDGKGAGSGRDQ